MKTIAFVLNGKPVSVVVEDNETLLHTLRERLSVTSVKEGCSIGECGACTVLIDDEPHYACLTLASKAEARDVKTVDFLGSSGMLHPLQEAFIKYGAVQCGYCTPGMLLSAYSLLLKNREPDRETIKEAISGNLCRCTGYIQIAEAIGQAAEEVQRSKLKVQGYDEKQTKNNGKSEIGNPQSKEEALFRLSEEEDVKVIAGGTDLVIKMREGSAHALILDITEIPELKGIETDGDDLRIGALVTHAKISRDQTIKGCAGSLSLACGWIGSPQIRNMGTLGGNLVNASPAADSIPPLLVHDAVLTIESKTDGREVRLEDFIVEPYKTLIRQDELLVAIHIKGLAGYREGYRRVTKRAAWAISRLSVAWAILEEDGFFKDVKLAIGSCTPMPFRPWKVEVLLKGREKNEGLIGDSVEAILKDIRDVTGERPSFAYKLPVLRGLLARALRG
jgi:xanthine dehydrogenase small subunit